MSDSYLVVQAIHGVEAALRDYPAPSEAFTDGSLDEIGAALRQVARALRAEAVPGRDAMGGTVDSVTEAVMGVTGGLVKVAEALREIASAIRAKEGVTDGEEADE